MRVEIQCREETDGVGVLCVSAATGTGPVEIDPFDSVRLDRTLDEQLAAGRSRLVIDLTNVRHVSSRGFWAIARTAKALALRSGRLVIASDSTALSRTIEITSASDAIVCRADRPSALAAVRA
jgi:anti-anti-sigma factor